MLESPIQALYAHYSFVSRSSSCLGVYVSSLVPIMIANSRHHMSLVPQDKVTLLPLALGGLISKPHPTTRSADKSLKSMKLDYHLAKLMERNRGAIMPNN